MQTLIDAALDQSEKSCVSPTMETGEGKAWTGWCDLRHGVIFSARKVNCEEEDEGEV